MKFRSGELILLGLSAENVRRLKLGMPIKFDGAEINLPGLTFGIVYGETEMALEKQLIDAGVRVPQ
jgi:hypothetical protein